MYNKRFVEIWKIMLRHYDFTDKTLLDVGCGYGDLIKAAYCEGGATVYGLDYDKEILQSVEHDNPNLIKWDGFNLIQDNVNSWSSSFYPFSQRGSQRVDIVTCMSVLPYFDKPIKTLEYFRQIADTLIIECQYYGDGPGLEIIDTDHRMKYILSQLYDNVEKIGVTFIEGRNKSRSIWLCR